MINGSVMSFNEKRGFGFVLLEDGRQAFVHYTNILGDGFKTLEYNEKVEFDLYETDKGLEARNIKRSK